MKPPSQRAAAPSARPTFAPRRVPPARAPRARAGGSRPSAGRGFRVASAGHVLFAAILIWLGVMGFMKGDFVPVWQPVPKWVPAREGLAYLCALISLGCGIGLLLQRTAAMAARVVLASFFTWL